MTTLLWRIEPGSAGPPNHTQLAEDLRLHLRYATVTSVLVQIGSQQQAYLSSTGCPGCRQQRCGPTCLMQLLRRALIASQAATDLRPLSLGLAARPYTRFALAWPGSHAQPLEQLPLNQWPELRLLCSWRRIGGRMLVAAVLAVGAGGPDPHNALRAHGWHTLAAQPLLRRLASATLPATLRTGWLSQLPPFLLLPQSAVLSGTGLRSPDEAATHLPANLPGTAEPPAGDSVDPVLFAQAMATLNLIAQGQVPAPADQPAEALVEQQLGGTQTASAPIQPALQAIDWPAGPADLPPERLGQLLTTLVQSETLTHGQPGRVGLAVPRLKRALGLTKTEAVALLCWLDQAQLLDPPPNPQYPWRQPRPLATASLQEIAARLQATPVPDQHTSAAAFLRTADS